MKHEQTKTEPMRSKWANANRCAPAAKPLPLPAAAAAGSRCCTGVGDIAAAARLSPVVVVVAQRRKKCGWRLVAAEWVPIAQHISIQTSHIAGTHVGLHHPVYSEILFGKKKYHAVSIIFRGCTKHRVQAHQFNKFKMTFFLHTLWNWSYLNN